MTMNKEETKFEKVNIANETVCVYKQKPVREEVKTKTQHKKKVGKPNIINIIKPRSVNERHQAISARLSRGKPL